MSKRKTTPALPSMDDLLSGQTEPVESPSVATSKSQDSQESEGKVKVTYYLPADLVERIDDAHYQINRATRGSGRKIHKYEMARVAWQLALQDFEESGGKSVFTEMVLGDS